MILFGWLELLLLPLPALGQLQQHCKCGHCFALNNERGTEEAAFRVGPKNLEARGRTKIETPLTINVGAKAKTPPFARGLRRPRCTNGDKTTGRLTLRLIRHRTKTCDEVVSSCDLVRHGGPRVIRPIVTGLAWPSRVTGLICKGLPVITICNPALWEYFRIT
jgi:hypothetical protein